MLLVLPACIREHHAHTLRLPSAKADTGGCGAYSPTLGCGEHGGECLGPGPQAGTRPGAGAWFASVAYLEVEHYQRPLEMKILFLTSGLFNQHSPAYLQP